MVFLLLTNPLELFFKGELKAHIQIENMKITLPPCLFVQPTAAHAFTIYLFDTHTSCYATFEESWCVEHYSL